MEMKKRILYIAAYPPAKNGGGELLIYKTIKNISKLGYEVDLVYFTYPEHNAIGMEYVNNHWFFKPRYFYSIFKLKFFPLFTRRFNKNILRFIRERADSYDLLFFDTSQVALYSMYIDHPNKIIRCHDIIYQKYQRKSFLLLPWVKFTEKKVLLSANNIFTLSNKDSSLVKDLYGLKTSTTIDILGLSDYQITSTDCNINNFLFFGAWSRSENYDGLIWFLKKVYPLVDVKKRIMFYVMGGGLSDRQKKLLAKYNFCILGFVDDCFSEIIKYKAVLVPLFQGAGVKTKVVDSFTTGTPVIGTDVAFEGIPTIPGLTYKCNNATEFADLINNFNSMTMEEKKEKKEIFMNSFVGKKTHEYINELL